MQPDARSGAQTRCFWDREVDDDGDDVGEPEETQRRLMAERPEWRSRLKRTEVVIRVDRPNSSKCLRRTGAGRILIAKGVATTELLLPRPNPLP